MHSTKKQEQNKQTKKPSQGKLRNILNWLWKQYIPKCVGTSKAVLKEKSVALNIYSRK